MSLTKLEFENILNKYCDGFSIEIFNDQYMMYQILLTDIISIRFLTQLKKDDIEFPIKSDITYGPFDTVSNKFLTKSTKSKINSQFIIRELEDNIVYFFKSFQIVKCPHCNSVLSKHEAKDLSYSFYSCLSCQFISGKPDKFVEITRPSVNEEINRAKQVLSHYTLSKNKFAQSLLNQVKSKGYLSKTQMYYVLGDVNPKGFKTFEKQVGLLSFKASDETINISELKHIVNEKRKEIDRTYRVTETVIEKPIKDVKLISTSKYKHIKYSFKEFNPIQSRMYKIHNKDMNIVLAAPTSSGKTICCEMAIGYEISKRKKAIYLSPLKALSQEKYDDWTKKIFKNKKISILTGDYQNTEKRNEEIKEADIICMTSEMLDSKTRKIDSERNSWLKDVRIIVVDEAHLITSGYENGETQSSNSRGDKLEAGIMRFTRHNKKARVILLSATMPNVKELCRWLKRLNKKETKLIYSTWRPTQLDVHYIKYRSTRFGQAQYNKFDETLKLLRQYSEDKFIIFVHSKKEGRFIWYKLKDDGIDSEFHNASASKDKRNEIEDLFRNGKLRVLIATSTIAWGLNLPARRVIIFGVHRGMNEVSELDIVQETGRAGRFGIDPKGDTYILLPDTQYTYHKERIENIADIESCLSNKYSLAFHINAEIATANIKDIKSCQRWFKRSLAYLQNKSLDEHSIQKIIDKLMDMKMVELKKDKLISTKLGMISSWLYFGPYDIFAWYNNFSLLFKNKKLDDLTFSWALIKGTSFNMGYVPSEMAMDTMSHNKMLSNKGLDISDSECTYSQIVYRMLRDTCEAKHNLIKGQIQYDAGRIFQALNMINEMYCKKKWDKKWLNKMELRLKYCVGEELIELVKIRGIGHVKAKDLYNMGIKTKWQYEQYKAKQEASKNRKKKKK